jgi:hypothetical protein
MFVRMDHLAITREFKERAWWAAAVERRSPLA